MQRYEEGKEEEARASAATGPGQDSWRLGSRSAFLHVVVIFGALWRPREERDGFCPRRDLRQQHRHRSPAIARHPDLQPRGAGALPRSPAGQQALMNKRPIRR